MSAKPGMLAMASDGEFFVMTEAKRAEREAENVDCYAAHLEACWNACVGLTPEQVSAVPRLIAWFRSRALPQRGDMDGEFEWLDRLFPEDES